MDLMPANTKNDIFLLSFTIILSRMLTVCYPTQFEAFDCDLLNSCVALKCQREKDTDVSQQCKIMAAMKISKHVKHSYFIIKACKWTILLLLYFLHFFDNICCTFQSVYSTINVYFQQNEAGVERRYTFRQILLRSRMAPRRGMTRHLWPKYNERDSVSGLGSARVNHNAEFCIFGLHQKILPYHPSKTLNISKNTYIYTSYTKISNLCRQHKKLARHFNNNLAHNNIIIEIRQRREVWCI